MAVDPNTHSEATSDEWQRCHPPQQDDRDCELTGWLASATSHATRAQGATGSADERRCNGVMLLPSINPFRCRHVPLRLKPYVHVCECVLHLLLRVREAGWASEEPLRPRRPEICMRKINLAPAGRSSDGSNSNSESVGCAKCSGMMTGARGRACCVCCLPAPTDSLPHCGSAIACSLLRIRRSSIHPSMQPLPTFSLTITIDRIASHRLTSPHLTLGLDPPPP